MIDAHSELLIRLADVPRLKWLPIRHGGRRLHLSTVYRWQQRGLRGIRLETIQVGGTRCTTEAALLRFFAALNASGAGVTTVHTNRARLARAKRELERARI